jgi:ATP-dependent Zn protease
MLAKAMAGESDVTFLQTSASEFKNKYVGESEANIRRIFAKAKKYAPAIIFIDEIDAIGRKRTGGENSSTTESMLNALLSEMDGFSGNDAQKPVFVLAATNYGVGAETDGISALDEALIRRFDNKIYVDLPKERERKEYIIRMLEKSNVTSISENTAESIAERTTGQSLAILQNVIDLAFRNAAKQYRTVNDDDLLNALEEYNFGEKKEYSPEYYRSVSIHETGHAYVSYISGYKPSYITIESRGNFGGYMQHGSQEDVTGYTKDELLAKIRTALAGRAAEQVFYGKSKSLNTGASSDLQHATDIAFQIVCTYGMEDEQLIVLRKEEVLKSALAAEYVAKVNQILKIEMNHTIEIIEEAKDRIQAIADILAKENRLTGKQFEQLMESK